MRRNSIARRCMAEPSRRFAMIRRAQLCLCSASLCPCLALPVSAVPKHPVAVPQLFNSTLCVSSAWLSFALLPLSTALHHVAVAARIVAMLSDAVPLRCAACRASPMRGLACQAMLVPCRDVRVLAYPWLCRAWLCSAMPMQGHSTPLDAMPLRCSSCAALRSVTMPPLRKAWRCQAYAPYSFSCSTISYVNVPLPELRHWQRPRRRP